jgi:RimJ/RimL family protein N-acetyltransferase
MTRPADRTDTSDAPQAAAEVTVRPIRDGEDAQVRAVAGRAFDAFDRLLFSTRGRETLVAADGDDRIVGGVVIHAAPSRTLGPLGVVHFIFADPDRHLPGIGTRLRDAADTRFDELGCTETSARIDVTNSASQALHRAGGYRPATTAQQVRRWGWRLPVRWAQAGTGFDPGMQLWLRPAPTDRPEPRTGRALVVTAALNLLLLLVVAWRAPRTDADPLTATVTLAATVAVFIGSREAAIRLTARAGGLRLGHVPWTNGLGLAGALAATFGVWFPLTGSSTSQRPGWRHDSDAAMLGRAHLAGALVVAALAWTIVLTEPSTGWLAWGEIRRVAVLLALFDLVLGFPPLIGTAARHIRSWSARAYGVVALFGVGPLVVTLL